MQKAAYAPPREVASTAPNSASSAVSELTPLVFTAPPREKPERGVENYGPVAAYLSQVLGKKVVYRHPGTWGVYRTKMVQGEYDMVFDGPHFNSYRADRLNHNILAKVPGGRAFAIIVSKDLAVPGNNVQRLAGRTFCTHAPPNLGTLILFNQFTNPARQPVIINTKGWENIYNGVASGKCVGGILPVANLKKYDTAGKTRAIFTSSDLPDQAFSAGPRVSPEDQARIAAALVSPQASGPTEKLRARYRVGNSFVAANNQEYTGIAEYLKNEWGYY